MNEESSLLTFKPHFHVEIMDHEQVVLFSEDRHHSLKGRIYIAIAELLNTSPTSRDSIFRSLAKNFSSRGHPRSPP